MKSFSHYLKTISSGNIAQFNFFVVGKPMPIHSEGDI